MRWPLERFGTMTDLITGEVRDAAWLRDAVSRRASVLVSLSIRRGDHVLIADGNTPYFFADLFAAWAAGACAACIKPTVAAAELDNLADFIAPAAVLVDAQSAAAGVPTVPVLCLRHEIAGDVGESPETHEGALDDPALVLFASGTTGRPKGAVLSFRAILARIGLNCVRFGTTTLRRTLCVLPTHFGHGLIGNCLTPLFARADLLLQRASGIRAPERWFVVADLPRTERGKINRDTVRESCLAAVP